MRLRSRAAVAPAVLASLLVVGAAAGRAMLTGAAPATIPTVRVQRGAVQIKVFTTGELRAAHSTQLIAPPIGGNLQIVDVAQTGQWINAGDTVVAFDAAEQV